MNFFVFKRDRVYECVREKNVSLKKNIEKLTVTFNFYTQLYNIKIYFN